MNNNFPSDLSEYFDPNPPKHLVIGKAYGEKTFNNVLIEADYHPLSAIITILNNIATVNIKENNIHSAKKILKKILVLVESNVNKVNKLVFLEAINNLGECFMEEGEYENAVECYQKCIDIYKELDISNDQIYYRYFFNLAEALRCSKQLNKAKVLFEDLLLMVREKKEYFYIDKGLLYNNYGLLLFDLGDYSAAKQYFIKAYEFYSKFFEKNHPVMKEIFNNLLNATQQVAAGDAK